MVWGCPRQKWETLSKTKQNKTKAKKAEGMVQVVEDLLSKSETLGSNPNTAKKIITKRKYS
jgi:hypothetical protein